MRLITQTLSGLVADDPNGVAISQTTGGAGDLTLDGVLAVSGVITLVAPQFLTLTSGGNLSASTVTISGLDETGLEIIETILGPNVATIQTLVAFQVINQISTDAAVGSAVEVGVVQSGATVPCSLDQYLEPFNVTLTITGTGTFDATVQYAFFDIFTTARQDLIWVPHSDLTNVTVNTGIGTLISPVTAVRMVLNSGSGSSRFDVQQAGV